MTEPSITAVFCTLDRYSLLKDAVTSLLNTKDFSKNLCEILIVDNTPESLRDNTLDFPDPVRRIICSELGLSHARNVAINQCSSELIAFLDDDVVVEDGWLTALITAERRNPSALAFGGKTTPIFRAETKPPWYYDELSSYQSCIDWGSEERFLKQGEWVVGANVAFRRSVFARVGLFDPALGRRGHASLLSNEEIAIFKAIGLDAVLYVPHMMVGHRIDEDRMTLEWFRKRISWQAVSDELANEGYLDSQQALNVFRQHIINCPAEYRTLNSLCFTPSDPRQCQSQFNAIYAYTSLLLNGLTSCVIDLNRGLV